jgi:hypothetical protein
MTDMMFKNANVRIETWIAKGRCKRILDLSNLQLETLPNLPATVRRLNITNNNLRTLIGLPVNLKELWLYNNPHLESLEGIPLRLRLLQLGGSCTYINDMIKNIKDLPNNIRTLYIHGMNIINIINLPYELRRLEILDCDYLQTIYAFPPKLVSLYMNEVKYDGPYTLPPFPNTLRIIELIYVSELKELPDFPSELRSLSLVSTGIKVLPKLPLKLINCSIRDCHLIQEISEIPLYLPKLLYFYYMSDNIKSNNLKLFKLDKLPVNINKIFYLKD